MIKIRKILMTLGIVLIGGLVLTTNVEAKDKSKLNHKKLNIAVGEKANLKVINYSGSVKWRSANKQIAHVSKSGKIEASWFGNTVIYAKLKNNKVLKCKVRVLPKTTWFRDKVKDGYHYRIDTNEISIMDVSRKKARVNMFIDNTNYGVFYANKKGNKYIFNDAGKFGVSGTIRIYREKCILKVKGKEKYIFNAWWDAA